MDIGLIFPYLEVFGGAQKYFLECIKVWQKKHDLTVYCVNYNQNILDECDIDININKLNVPNNLFFENNYFKNYSLIFKSNFISNQIGKHEIYNSHVFPSYSLNLEDNIWTPQEPSRDLYDLRVSISDNNISFSKSSFYKRLLFNIPLPFLKRLDQSNYRVALTIANSDYSRKYLEEVYNCKINHIVYPGVDYKEYNRYDVEKDKNCILFVSRLEFIKGCDEVIKFLQYLDDSFYLEIVGKGPYKEELISLAKRLKVDDRVHFNGFLTNEELVELYKKSLCCVFLPYREPFGMVVLEFLAAGTPIIGNIGGGGFTELIKDGYNGFLINKNPKEVANKIKFLYDNEDLYDKMVINCREVAKNHTWNDTASQNMNIFKEYLNNK